MKNDSRISYMRLTPRLIGKCQYMVTIVIVIYNTNIVQASNQFNIRNYMSHTETIKILYFAHVSCLPSYFLCLHLIIYIILYFLLSYACITFYISRVLVYSDTIFRLTYLFFTIWYRSIYFLLYNCIRKITCTILSLIGNWRLLLLT